MQDNIEHGAVTRTLESGYPDGKEPKGPRCPVCDKECETIYFDRDGTNFGCDECIVQQDAGEVDDCFPGKE